MHQMVYSIHIDFQHSIQTVIPLTTSNVSQVNLHFELTLNLISVGFVCFRSRRRQKQHNPFLADWLMERPDQTTTHDCSRQWMECSFQVMFQGVWRSLLCQMQAAGSKRKVLPEI